MEKLHQFAKNPRTRRRGYRLVHKELERQKAREGKPLNVERIHRLWRREGLSIPPRRRKKKIRSGKPATGLVAVAPRSVWCLDFIQEKTIHQQVLRILCVSDEFTRELLVIEVESRFVSSKVRRRSPAPDTAARASGSATDGGSSASLERDINAAINILAKAKRVVWDNTPSASLQGEESMPL